MSFEIINQRLTQIEDRVTEIEALVNVRKGQKSVHEQISGLYDTLMKMHNRINNLEQQKQ
jgi:tetrahydromethanopterin S-methyltransferase subunit G